MAPRISPRGQGDMGEHSAIGWLLANGFSVSAPYGHSPPCDLIAEDRRRLLRFQVKTSTVYCDNRSAVTICSRRGNRSRSGLVKRLDLARIEYLFVLVAAGRRPFIPADAIEGATGIHLGAPKYVSLEVERGPPLVVGFGA